MLNQYLKILALLVIFAFTACDDDDDVIDTDLCEDVVCESWEGCLEGDCLLLEGRCNLESDCGENNMFCDDANYCQGPTAPLENFLDQISGNSLTLEFQGVINPVSFDMLSADHGTGEFGVHFPDEDYVVDTEIMAVAYQAAQSGVEITEWEGESIVGIYANKELETVDGTTYKIYASVGMPTVEFQNIMAAGIPELIAPAAARVFVSMGEFTEREFDGSVFERRCQMVDMESNLSESNIFLSFFDNTEFAVGEDIHFWANFSIGEKLEITAQNEGDLCLYYINNRISNKNDWYSARAMTEPLTCEIPDGFLDPRTEPYMTFWFTSRINDYSVNYGENYGISDIVLQWEGQRIIVSDLYSLVFYYEINDLLYVQGLGDSTLLSNGVVTSNMFRFIIRRSALEQMKTDGLSTIPFDPENMGVTVDAIEELYTTDDAFVKSCPLLISNPETTDGTVLSCNADNVDFMPGEMLELAVTADLTDDATLLIDAYGSVDCSCTINNAYMDCADFDAMK
jgi:hypothetical protein